jgi:hypothetical protein
MFFSLFKYPGYFELLASEEQDSKGQKMGLNVVV